MMRKAIERSRWYPTLRTDERERLIEQDVDQHWHLMMDEARKRLLQSRGG